MAYLRPIDMACNDCHRRATQELRNSRNENMGRYCTLHANRRLRAAQQREREQETAAYQTVRE